MKQFAWEVSLYFSNLGYAPKVVTLDYVNVALKLPRNRTSKVHVTRLKIFWLNCQANGTQIVVLHVSSSLCRKQKSNKASGLDNLPQEIFKTYPHTIAKTLETMFKKYVILAKP